MDSVNLEDSLIFADELRLPSSLVPSSDTRALYCTGGGTSIPAIPCAFLYLAGWTFKYIQLIVSDV